MGTTTPIDCLSRTDVLEQVAVLVIVVAIVEAVVVETVCKVDVLTAEIVKVDEFVLVALLPLLL